MHMPVRIGVPRGIKGLVELVNNPAYATAVGLCLYEADKPGYYHRYNGSHTFEKLLERMIRWFKEVF
jgi:cell division protein FtsA